MSLCNEIVPRKVKRQKGTTMKLISWNVNGLRACMTKGFADFLAASDADIFCVQETKMLREQATFDFPDYFEYWNSA